ncbi:MAG: metallophosphoesterase [Cyanobacteria bacterium P01_H01_bin.26]
MSPPFLLAQITDTHLLAQPTAQLRGCNPWRSLTAVLQQVARYNPDGLLLTGDLAERGEAAAYGHLVSEIAPLKLPTYWLPGNHDSLGTLRPILDSLPASQGLKSVDLGAWQLILLNSVLPQATVGEGCLSSRQLQRLEADLTRHPTKPTLIALHHHPVPVGIDWVDQMQLQNAGELLALLNRFANVRVVVFGHIHHGFHHCPPNGPDFYGCPSTCLQVAPPRPQPDQPGFRLLWLYANGTHQTAVKRVRAAGGDHQHPTPLSDPFPQPIHHG